MQLLLDDEFWPLFFQDLRNATGQVHIESAFISSQRLVSLAKPFRELAARGVIVCAYLQKPKYWNTPVEKLRSDARSKVEELQKNIGILEAWNVHVNLRPLIHGKMIVIDRHIHYEGSLNALSHVNGEDHMRRFASRAEAENVLKKLKLTDCFECDQLKAKYWFGSQNPNLRLKEAGRLLSDHRKNRGWSLCHLSRVSGIGRKTIREIESGINFRLETHFKLLHVLELEMLLVPKHMVSAVSNFAERNKFELSTEKSEHQDLMS